MMASQPKLALKSSDIATWSWDIVNNSMTWDDDGHPLLGLQPGALPRRYEDFLSLLSPADQERVGHEILKSIETQTPWETEFGVVWPDGSIHVLAARGMAAFDETGRPVRMAGLCWDISEGKRAEERQDQLTSVVEASDDAIIWNTLDGIIVGWNKGAERVYGYLANEVIGKPISILLPPDRADELPEIMERLGRGESIDHYETVRQGKDGRLIEVSLAISPIREPIGRISGASSSTRDITELKRAERALNKSEDRYRRLFETAQDGILILSEAGIIADVNPFLLEMLEYSKAQLVGKHLCDIGFLADSDLCQKAFRSLQDCGYVRYDDLPLETQSGKRLEVEFVSNVYVAGGEYVIQCNIRDISERKRVEAENVRLVTAIEQAAEAVIITDREARIQYANPAFTRLTGYSLSDVLGQHPRILKSGQHDQTFYQNMWSTILSGQVWHSEMINRRKDGTLYPEEMTITPVSDSSGLITNFVAIKQDVTERQRAEAKIRELNEQLEQRIMERTAELATANKELGRERDLLHSLMDNIPDCIYFKDAASRFTVINRAQAQIMGIQYPEAAVGKTDFDYFAPQFAQEAFADEQAILKSGNPVISKVQEIKRPDGTSLWVSTTKMQIRDVHGSILGTFGVSHDVTKSKRFEQALREKNVELESALLTKDLFLASMSHELRTPLNAVIGFTGTLLMRLPGPLNDEQAKQLQIIRSSAKHLLSLLNDLLDLAKITSGKVALSVEPVVFQGVMEEVCTALRPLAEQKGLELKATVPGRQLVLNTDRRALSQILFNLVNNAIKFTQSGEVRIVLDRQKENGRSWTEVSVHDTGIGIRPEDQPKLFEAFSQVDRRLRRNEGAGLGLQLSQKLAGLLGGQISFQSEYGKGSTFTLSLPESSGSEQSRNSEG